MSNSIKFPDRTFCGVVQPPLAQYEGGADGGRLRAVSHGLYSLICPGSEAYVPPCAEHHAGNVR